MPTNEQRREAAKRKLQRQLERRAQQARRRRILALAGAAVAVVVALAAVAAVLITRHEQHKPPTASPSTTPTSSASHPGVPALPPFTPSANLGKCDYPPSPEPASKQVNPPKTQNGKVPTDPPQVSVSMVTDQGNVGLLLANAKSPCTVNSFVSLATQKFFDDTKCHRLTTSASLGVLQCGDPTGDGTGGPGYQFANEYPSDQYKPEDPAANQPVLYPRGTLAMANSGPNTNGSQFFLVYKDSQLPPAYTVFGTIQQDGLATLDKVAKGGVAGGGEDGAPTIPVTLKSVRLD